MVERHDVMRITNNGFAWFQFGTVTILAALGMFYYYYENRYPDDFINAAFEVFDVGDETSIQTVFSTFNLALASALAFVVHRTARKQGDKLALGWLILSVVLLLLSLDEGAAIHERAGTRFLQLTGLDIPMIQDHKWLLAGGLITLVVAPIFVPFLLRLDNRTRLLLMLSGLIFLGGALGLEFLGAWMMHEYGYVKSDLVYRVRRVAEESFEMYGIALLNCTLLGVIWSKGIVVTLTTEGRTSPLEHGHGAGSPSAL